MHVGLENSQSIATTGDAIEVESSSPPEQEQREPSILKHLTVGINEVTKRLEAQASSARRIQIGSSSNKTPSDIPLLSVVFVCRADVDPPLLVDHLPHLVAAGNSSPAACAVKIVPLPKGAESALSKALGLRRAAVIAIDVCHLRLAQSQKTH